MAASGTTAFSPFVSDFVLDAYRRCGVKPTSLEIDHMISARMSSNLVLANWTTLGVNLWKVDTQPTIIDLVQGTAVYPLDPNVVGLLDCYIRTPQSPPAQTTAPTGNIIPFLVGNPISMNATFITTAGSNIVTVDLIAHGFTVGEFVSILNPVVVGGLTMGGVYEVISVPNANSFTLNSTFNATSNSQVTVNGGSAAIDLLLYPLSRNDYAAIPQKGQQGRPTSIWFQREINPQITIWPEPDAVAPYQFQGYLLRQIQDANPVGGQTMDIPYRAFYAFVTALAQDLAVKVAPERLPMLTPIAMAAWQSFSDADREVVSVYMCPDFSGYG
jgi:hypothetical protein